MVYSKTLASRINDMLARRHGIAEKEMFGGVGFLLHGNMLVGVWQDSLIVRIGVETYKIALDEQYVKEFDITGRSMKGWVMVEPEGIESDEQLGDWIERAIEFVVTLPRK